MTVATTTSARRLPAARRRPFEAVISDMDGVLTRTARLHARAWKRMFDDLLRRYEGQRPFSDADYRAYVDGKPRYAGVADFLASRHIELPRGQPSDGPGDVTICGLGNRKNGFFLELLESDGVEVFDDTVGAVDRWRRGQMKLAAVSSSRNCRRVLRAAGLEDRFDVIVDGQVAEELGLEGKPGIMLEAARRLAVAPADAVILEDATAGIRAGRRDGFGLVVGVARADNTRDLREAGADVVTRNVARLRFPRRLPNALERVAEMTARRGARPLAVVLDYDGTLAPVVPHPRDARMSEAMRSAVRALARRCPVAILSGRDREDIEARVGIEGILYVGNHGFDIAGGGHRRAVAEARQVLDDVDRAERELRQRVGRISGAIVERRRYSVAAHHLGVGSEAARQQVERAVEAIRAKTGLRKRTASGRLELEPAVDWDEGRAVRWLMDAVRGGQPQEMFVLYLGDDEADEDAFAALGRDGAGVRVGGAITTSLADYHLEGPEEVQRLLESVTASLD